MKQFLIQQLQEELHSQLASVELLEEKLDLIRIFKKKHFKETEKKQFEENEFLPDLFKNLSYVAEVIVQETFVLAQEEISKSYGYPCYVGNQGSIQKAHMAVVAMGKLGGEEIHYESDLDLIFIFSKNGETKGKKEISNQEYFSKLAQRFISYLSLYSIQGSAFKVDTLLRPSGRQGALVSSLDTFADYQKNYAAFWEKQALLKARVLAGENLFKQELESILHSFVSQWQAPSSLNNDIYQMRLKIQKEMGEETALKINFRYGPGGLTDIEFAVQYIQLKYLKLYPAVWCANTFESLIKIGEKQILHLQEIELLKEAYLFYRKLETILEIKFDFKNPYLNPQAPFIENLVEEMNLENEQEFIHKIKNLKKEVREIFLRVLGQKC